MCNYIFRIPQWGDPDEISWPEGLDHSNAIDITPSEGGSGGGITNCSLTPNGYVIFDCGLIIQWFSSTMTIHINNNYVAYTVYNTNLPISFTTTDYKVAVCLAYTNHYANLSYYRTVSMFGATNDTATGSVIAIGW